VKNGTCPKCESKSIYCGDKIPLKNGPFGSNSIPVSIISIAALDNYVCTDCGYIESYIAEKDKRKEIIESWRSINASEEGEE
jgi:hypothetical protein